MNATRFCEASSSPLVKGQTVGIINQNGKGYFILEGYAKLVKHIFDEQWLVKFSNGDKVERFINLEAQADVPKYIAELNERVGHGR